jgi:hypothetical protein
MRRLIKASPANWLEHAETLEDRILQEFRESRFFKMHDVLASAGRRSDENKSPEDRRPIEHHLLRHHATERKPDDVAPFESERVDECECVLCHARHRIRHLAARPAEPGALEKNDLAPLRKWIGHRRVPIVERPREILEEEKRGGFAVAETAVGVFLVLHGQELRRSCYIARFVVSRHFRILRAYFSRSVPSTSVHRFSKSLSR